MDDIDFDDALPYVGEFGLYQWLLLLSMAPFCVNVTFIYLSQFFMTLPTPFVCAARDQPQHDLLPLQPLDRCEMFDKNYNAVPCTVFEYNYTEIRDFVTINAELNWVCSRGWYATAAQAAFFIGAIFGGILFGWMADRYGRVTVLFLTNIIGAAASLLTATCSTFGEFVFYRICAGLAFDNIFVMMYVLALEYVGPRHRTLVANLSIAIFYTLGTVILPWLAVAVGHWRLFSVAVAVPMALTCFSYWILPESARWLLTVGRVDETLVILKKIAKVNKRVIPKKILERLRKSYELDDSASTNLEDSDAKDQESVSILDLLRTPRMRRISLLAAFLWMILGLVYDAHNRNVSNLGSDVYITFTIACSTELPADVLLVFILDRWGRRWLAFLFLVLAGLFSVLVVAVPAESYFAIAALAIAGRFCINVAFNIGLQYSAELLPTVVRAQGVGAIHVMGYIAALASPLIVYMGETIHPLLPLIILGILSIVGGIMALYLPETLHCDLPQTIEDGENFGKNQPFFYFPCLARAGEVRQEPLREITPRPSFIRHKSFRASIRGETYRSSLIRHRREVLYIPSAD